ncbi:MAG: hypothetical protein KTR31_04950 [Myxococcales bacterium]|nr:hypothetical protein [Myxococcales bacterium]
MATLIGDSRLSWAQARLRLGMANVGFWVLTAVLALAAVWAGPSASAASEGARWLLMVGLFALAQAPFDLVGGWWLPRTYHRAVEPFGAWLSQWARGVAVHSAVWSVAGLALLLAQARGGWLGAMAVGTAGMAAVVALQGPLTELLSGRSLRPVPDRLHPMLARAGLDPARVKLLAAPEPSFVGGWVGLPGRDTLIVPGTWLGLPDSVWVTQLTRRAQARARGWRAHGLASALVFNVVGLGLALWMVPSEAIGTAGGLLVVSATFTLWSFLGLLTLPSRARPAVAAVDAAAVAAGLPRTTLHAALPILDARQEDEPTRPDVVEAIFHPVPSLSSRLDAPTTPLPARVPYRIARNTLTLSWVCLGGLSRAVHCNAGLPTLWAIPPGD